MRLMMPLLICSTVLATTGAGKADANELKEVENKAAPCFVCHGDKGKSDNAQVPSLAGQQSVYIVNQLSAYKDGSRTHSTMQSLAAQLSDEDINNFGAYFAVQKPAKSGGDAALMATGKAKATMCLGCHGGSGEGNGQFPRLAGQHADYLSQQLGLFKSGVRKNATMQAIAGTLTDDDIKAIAAYFAGM